MPKKNLLLLVLCALLIGPVAAISGHLFLTSLDYVTLWRLSHPILIWTLPLLGFAMTFAYKKIPAKINWSVTHFLFELRNPRHRANPFSALWIFLTTCLIHLGGGSAGREGAGLIISAGLVDGAIPFKEDSEERTHLLQAALSAGFTGVFGTPLTALFFIFEVNNYKSALSPLRWITVILAISSTTLTAKFLGTPHDHFPAYTSVSWKGFGLLLLAIPIAAYGFYYALKFFHKSFKHLGFFELPVGGLMIALIVTFIGSRYSGLGISAIANAVAGNGSLPWDWIAKILLTALTIGVGFKGGEVTPLFFIGSTLGATLSVFSGDVDLAKLGMVSLFGALTHSPLSMGILAAELFGPTAFVGSFIISLWGKYTLRGRHLYRLE